MVVGVVIFLVVMVVVVGGKWVPAMRGLARLRWLRGTAFDPFGYNEERRTERRLIAEYTSLIEQHLATLDHDNVEQMTRLAALPDMIRGFGHVKKANIEQYHKQLRAILDEPAGKDHVAPMLIAAE